MMILIRNVFIAGCLAILFAATLANGQERTPPQQKPVPTEILNISGEVAHPLKLTDADFAKLPRHTIHAKDHGVETIFEGVALVEVLKLAGVEFGESLRGKRLETYLLVEAADNYAAVFALPGLDPAFTDQIILLADRRDDKPLSKEEGTLRVVVPREKRAARSVRKVVNLIVRRARP